MANVMAENIVIRPAVRTDCAEIFRLIKELAEFEKMPNKVKITQETLEKDGFESTPPMWKAFVAEVKEQDETKDDLLVGRLVGLASYFMSYHTFSGYRMFLEQLYVTQSFQNKFNLEQRLYETVTKAGVELNCAQIDWFCLSWNPARNFYEKLGAINITEKEDWNVYRLDKDTMLQISSK
uniref:Diamine acetyltransferase 2 n=1 Tax=Cacopsylla melanoneura TaxID=428564 RepID=A0A8D9F3N2_9HEMI